MQLTEEQKKAADTVGKAIADAFIETSDEAYARGVAAERARIRAKVEELHDLAAENLMPMGDPYYEGARDYLDILLQFFDAGEPKTEGEG